MSRETNHEIARREGREAALVKLKESIDALILTVKDEESIKRGEKERENFKKGVKEVCDLAHEHCKVMILKHEGAR
ncbi:MAG: hypothetical protein OXB98_01060 [Bryobacterales bacterium]|nr:hypothetical protein [Bryobacterales bacterium]